MTSRQVLIQQQLMPTRLALSSYARFAPLSGWQVVLLSQRPTAWQPSRNSVDQALKLQRQQQLLLHEYNVTLAGVWYWQPGLLRRVQPACESMSNYIQRYPQHQHVLLASRNELLRAGQRLGLSMIAVDNRSMRSVKKAGNLQQAIDLLAAETL